jgi:hypothetical protein
MISTSTRIAENLGLLRQAASLVSGLDAETYGAPGPPPGRGGVGGHIRHVLDFYDCFLRGVPAGRVDYEARSRDARAASDPVYAVARIAETAGRLEGLGAPAACSQLLVRAEGAGPAGCPGSWGRSSLARELEFLMSHTVHHFAIVAMLLRLRGVEPGEGLGVAPSTLAYWRSAS